MLAKQAKSLLLSGVLLAGVLSIAGVAAAVEVEDKAPDFNKNEVVSNNLDEARKILSMWNDGVGPLFGQGKFEEMVREYYTAECILSAPDFPSQQGHDAIIAWYEENARSALADVIAGRATVELKHTRDQEVTILGDYAIHYEEATMVLTPVAGDQAPFELPRKYMHIFKREEGHWKLHRYIFNNDISFQLTGEALK